MKNKNIKRWLAVVLAAALVLGLTACGNGGSTTTTKAPDASSTTTGAPSTSGTQTAEAPSNEDLPLSPRTIMGTVVPTVTGYAWGPAVDTVTIRLEDEVSFKEEDRWTDYAEYFTVSEKKKGIASISETKRTITKALFKDEKTLTLMLQVGPEEGSPFNYNMATWRNTWAENYEIVFSMADGKTLEMADGEQIILKAEQENEITDADMPQLELFSWDNDYIGAEGHTLSYAYFDPGNGSEDNLRPLVIWLHGAGEGGTDPRIALYGNQVTRLNQYYLQEPLRGAYVLVPQCPTFWMQYTESGSWSDNPGKDSVYLHDLKELIDFFVAENHVDPDRIIIAGCSNGGYMTMDMILNYPDYFAAAIPICEAYNPAGITDEQLEKIKDLPIWFIYAKNDTTVNPKVFEEPLIERLTALGAPIHVSAFDDVHDTTGMFEKNGQPYQYNGHWSWIYFFNWEVWDDNLHISAWMDQVNRSRAE